MARPAPPLLPPPLAQASPPPLSLAETGARAARLVMPDSDWVHRRVQQISYVEPGLQMMQLTIDFTVPSGSLGSHVPISVLPKRPPLYRFDFRTADDSAVPLLTTKQNGDADEALLRQLVRELSPASLESPEFDQALRKLARGPEPDLALAFWEFFDGLRFERSDCRSDRLIETAAMLADTILLWYPIGSSEPGTRTVCKLEYLIRSDSQIGSWARLKRSLSWSQPPESIHLWHAGSDANFHLDIEVPHLLTIQSAETQFLQLESEPLSKPLDGDAATSIDDDTIAAEKQGDRPTQHVDLAGRFAHLYVSGRRPQAADLSVLFAPARTGMVLSAFLASLLIAVLATAFYKWRSWASLPSHVDAAVAILILVPALIGYVVVRPADHPMARRYIVGIQLVSTAAAAVPLLMALLLIRFAEDPSGLHEAWRWPVYIAWALAAVLLGGLLGAGSGFRGRPPQAVR